MSASFPPLISALARTPFLANKPVKCWVHCCANGESKVLSRTIRSLQHAGLDPEAVSSNGKFIDGLLTTQDPLLLVSAGAWLVQHTLLPAIQPSATCRPLVALGALRDSPGAKAWSTVLKKRGGDFDHRTLFAPRIPTPVSAWLEAEPARRLGQRLAAGDDWSTAWRRVLALRAFRKVHLPALDVRLSQGLRVLQVVTSIQIGGAERVTLDLAEGLSQQDIAVAVAALGRPGRTALPKPAVFFDLSHVPRGAETCGEAVADVARHFGADLIHGHLLSGEEARAIRAHGFPVVMTLHNMPAGWPPDLCEAGVPAADLVLACSDAVAAEARQAGLQAPVRTVWNGIHPESVKTQQPPGIVRRIWRERFSWAEEDFVILAVANPRQQKRLARLPAILTAAQRLLRSRPARLLLVGSPNRGSADGSQSAEELAAAIAASPLSHSVREAGVVSEIGEALAASDVLVSVSAFEGLSLAHLEALAAGLPVVATDVGGTREIAAQCPALRLVAPDASDEDIAQVLTTFVTAPPTARPTLPASFQRSEMAARTRWFYQQLLSPRSPSGEGVWLITNNFSTGGAQSSARRLLLGLKARGVKVRAAVIEEHPGKPTPGRAALHAAEVCVLALPPPEVCDASDAVAVLLEAIAADRPRAVIFWNVIPVFKVLITDSLLDVPIYDVSPGEMFFASMARYFAKPRAALPCRDARDYGARLAGVVVKYESEAEVARRTLGAPVHVISNGVPMPAPRDARRSSKVLVIGTAARLSADKRLGDLLEAVRLAAPRLPSFVLRIAGGVERGSEAHARELRRVARGLPVEWCGELADTGEFLSGLDLFVMISEPSGCPNASLEALAAGVPVIATDVGGAREQIRDGVNGRLVPRRDAATLAEAIVDLAHNPAQRTAFGEAGRIHIGERFSMERMVESYQALCGL